MPICSAVLAAALLSGPAGAPADPAPLSAHESSAPGKQIAALAMNHPDEPDFVASKALDLLHKGTKAGPFNMSDESDNQANGPMGQGQAANAPTGDAQAPDGETSGARPAGDPVAGGPMSGNQANGSQPGSMFTMPAINRNNGGRSPQDVFMNPSANQPTYTKMSGNDFSRTPSSRQTDDDEDAGAWARPLQNWSMQKPSKAKAAKPKATKATKVSKATPKTADADDFWNIPGWD